MTTHTNGILLLYHHWVAPNAPTIMEHVRAFERYSRFKVWPVNTELGFPGALDGLSFRIIVLHYSLFGWLPFSLSRDYYAYLQRSRASHKIAFFQDEYRYWPQRAEFLSRNGIACVYTLVEPPYFKETYVKHTQVPKLIHTLPGYVSDDLLGLAKRFAQPNPQRTIDIGYRGRQLPHWFGRGAQEKHWIGVRFRELAGGRGLRLDIESKETKRLYGDKYYQFLANCRAVLGVEAGTSIFDIDDTVRPQYERLTTEHPGIGFDEAYANLLHRFEDKIPYRTISPRHFEAAAFRVCQILFAGRYSGIMQPMIHYLPLKKDFSNLDEVVRQFKDEALRRELTENAYQDLIASGRYNYRRFVESFDRELLSAGFAPGITPAQSDEVTSLLGRGSAYRQLRARATSLRYRQFPGRRLVGFIVRPLLGKLKTMRQERL